MEASQEYKNYMKHVKYTEQEFDKELGNIKRQIEKREAEIKSLERVTLANYAEKYELCEVFDRLQEKRKLLF